MKTEFFRNKAATHFFKVDEQLGKIVEIKMADMALVDGRCNHVFTLEYNPELAKRIRDNNFKITKDEFTIASINMQEENAKSLFA